MAYSKFKRILLILLCIFVLIFPFWCVAGLCAESENVTIDTVNNLHIDPNSNFFTYSDHDTVGYFQLEKGYIYTITIPSSFSADRYVALSNSTPAINVVYDFLATVKPGESYSFISDSSNSYLYFTYSSSYYGITVTRTKIDSMNGAVDDLVTNVGVDSIWNIFDISINYIYIVVLVAFGIFIISLVIRKITKGKEGF